MQNNNSGVFIAFIGLPGVGKSTFANELAKVINAKVFIEPGEEAWPIDHDKPWEQQVGKLEKWVCESNAENFRQARVLADSGAITVADAGIFLVNKEFIYASCSAWYYGHLTAEEKQQLYGKAQEDWKNTRTRPDVLVLIETDKSSWLYYMEKRGRKDDSNADCIKEYESQKKQMALAAETYAREHEAVFVRFENEPYSMEQKLNELVKILASSIGVNVACRRNFVR